MNTQNIYTNDKVEKLKIYDFFTYIPDNITMNSLKQLDIYNCIY